MPRTHEKVSYLPTGKPVAHTPLSAAIGMESALRLLDGRWKLLILFHLFGRQVQRFSDLERLIDGVSQKMLAQQLRQMEEDGLVIRTAHPEVPPRVEYSLTPWAEALCPALEAMLKWIEARQSRGD
jgi:DNA-binding HxlR family transcriptional regulator